MELKGEINSNTITFGDFTIPLSTWMDHENYQLEKSGFE